MLFIDIIWFLLLGLYFDQIMSSKYGIAKPWYFICTKRFWCGKKKNRGGSASETEHSLINQTDQDFEV